MEQKNGNYRKYTSKNPLMRRATARFLETAESMVSSVDVTRVLDMGCGEGFVAGRMGDKNVTGIDRSRPALDVAKAQSPAAAFACGDIYGMPFKPESFDLVLGMEVLEHLDDPEKAMVEAGRLSRRYCLFSVPHEPFFMAMNMLRGKNLRRLGSDPEHVHNWTYRGFVGMVSRYYDIVDVRTPFPWTMILCEKKVAMTEVSGDDQ